jgi:hypothetical protein
MTCCVFGSADKSRLRSSWGRQQRDGGMVSSLALASRRAVEAQGGCFDEDGPFVVSQDNAWKYTAIACSSSTVDWLMTLCAGRAEFEGLVFPSTMACWLLAVSAGCWLLAAGARTRLPVPTLHLPPFIFRRCALALAGCCQS